MGAGKVRLHSNGFSQGTRSILELAFLFQHRTQRVIGLRIIRLGANCRAQLLRRRGKISLLPERHAERVVRVRLTGIESRRPTQLDDRFRKLVL